MSLPYQAMLNPLPAELRRLIRDAGAVRGPISLHPMVRAGKRGICTEPPQLRHRVGASKTKTASTASAGLVFPEKTGHEAQLISQGRALNLSTMARQGRYDPEFGDKQRWETLVEAAFACSEVSFPAAFAGSHLAAYMVTCREHRWLHILCQMSRQDDL